MCMGALEDYHKDKLRKEFIKALEGNKCGNVVDDLLDIICKDYVLLVRHPLYCKDCVHCHQNYNSFDILHNSYCQYYQKRINDLDRCDYCEHYFGAELEASKSVARITGGMFYDKEQYSD